MIKKYVPLLLICTLCLIMGTIGCAKRVQVENLEGQPIPRTSVKLTDAKVKDAIVKGIVAQGWQAIPDKGRSVRAMLNKGKYQVTVSVVFTQTDYAIRYENSEGLKYEEGKIHSSYGRWLRNLKRSIDGELSRIQ